MILAPGSLSQSPAGGGEEEDNQFQGKQTEVRCFLILVVSASHQQEEEKRTGSKVNREQLE
jgi:hypothetical protein